MKEQQKALIAFQFEKSPVRIIKDDDGNHWWVAKDICDILSHSNYRMAVDGLDDDEKGVTKVYTPGGLQEMITVSESGLYTLIIRSNKPEARPFRKWVTSEVLPAIRRTGSYASGHTVARLTIFLNDVAAAGYCNFNQLKEYCWLRSLGLTQDMAGKACGIGSLHHVQIIDRRLRAVGITFPNLQFATRRKLMDAAFEKFLAEADPSVPGAALPGKEMRS